MISIDGALEQIRGIGLEPVPVHPMSKKPKEDNFNKKKFSDAQFRPNDNIGAGLEQSDVCHVDLDNRHSVALGARWLPSDTLIVGRRHVIEGHEIEVVTNWFFQNNGIISENQSLKDINQETVLEFRCNGHSVIHGKTLLKDDNNKHCERYFHNYRKPAYCENLQQLVNKIYVASMLCDLDVGMNEGALKLDSCLMRYTNWTDEQRVDFLMAVGEITRPQGRDTKVSKMQRIVKSNNTERKNSGYVSFAQYLGVDKLMVKNLFKKLGSVPDNDQYEKVKSIVDFNSKSIDVEELMQKIIPPLKWSVLPIMPEGLGFISGRPKAMKSWTVLGICYAVQNGTKFMGHETTQGDVMYLALEDSERRIKDRIIKLGYHKLKHPTILLASDVPYLGFGFEECIENWIKTKDNPRLIIIDTLARIRPRARKSSGTAYDIDNDLLSKIQTIAIQNNITIACVTHLSKQQQDYSFDRIQGSVGIQGIADFMWMIDRGDNSNHASIIGRGRDMNDFEYAVNWNEDKWQYDFTGNLHMVQLTENRRQVIDAMQVLCKDNEEVSPKDVCKHYQVSVMSKEGKRISKTMQRMKGDFELVDGNKYGTYKLPTQVDTRPENPEPRKEKQYNY